jgi:hypothetical protein
MDGHLILPTNGCRLEGSADYAEPVAPWDFGELSRVVLRRSHWFAEAQSFLRPHTLLRPSSWLLTPLPAA